MGSHEFNAITWFTADPDDAGTNLRRHSDKIRNQLRAFLAAYEGTDDHPELIEWLRSLPLWLDQDGLRVVHARWDDKRIQTRVRFIYLVRAPG